MSVKSVHLDANDEGDLVFAMTPPSGDEKQLGDDQERQNVAQWVSKHPSEALGTPQMDSSNQSVSNPGDDLTTALHKRFMREHEWEYNKEPPSLRLAHPGADYHACCATANELWDLVTKSKDFKAAISSEIPSAEEATDIKLSSKYDKQTVTRSATLMLRSQDMSKKRSIHVQSKISWNEDEEDEEDDTDLEEGFVVSELAYANLGL